MKPYKIGYTTGVFDLFHVGHLNIISRAKEQCDYLIVGVSTDELVRDYKKKQPAIPYDERKTIVESIKHVDLVVPQVNQDKFLAWQQLQFDLMFHGNDWKGTALFNQVERKLKKVGVEVVYFPYTQGVSSTMVKQTIRETEPIKL